MRKRDQMAARNYFNVLVESLAGHASLELERKEAVVRFGYVVQEIRLQVEFGVVSAASETRPPQSRLVGQHIHIRLHALLEVIGPVSAGFVFVGVVRPRNRRRCCLGFSCGLSGAGL
jgi:hypothetical protein